MTTHEEISNLLSRSRHLTEAEKTTLVEHLQVCESCVAKWAVYQAMDKNLAQLPAQDSAPWSSTRVQSPTSIYPRGMYARPGIRTGGPPSTWHQLPYILGQLAILLGLISVMIYLIALLGG